MLVILLVLRGKVRILGVFAAHNKGGKGEGGKGEYTEFLVVRRWSLYRLFKNNTFWMNTTGTIPHKFLVFIFY